MEVSFTVRMPGFVGFIVAAFSQDEGGFAETALPGEEAQFLQDGLLDEAFLFYTTSLKRMTLRAFCLRHDGGALSSRPKSEAISIFGVIPEK